MREPEHVVRAPGLARPPASGGAEPRSHVARDSRTQAQRGKARGRAHADGQGVTCPHSTGRNSDPGSLHPASPSVCLYNRTVITSTVLVEVCESRWRTVEPEVLCTGLLGTPGALQMPFASVHNLLLLPKASERHRGGSAFVPSQEAESWSCRERGPLPSRCAVPSRARCSTCKHSPCHQYRGADGGRVPQGVVRIQTRSPDNDFGCSYYCNSPFATCHLYQYRESYHTA